MRLPLIIGLGLTLAGCTGPDSPARTGWWSQAQPAPYYFPRDPAVSDARGRPHDSLTFYLPLTDSLYYYTDETGQRRDARPWPLRHLSGELYYFRAPVLRNVPQPGRTWRLLRDSGFDRTTLFTLRELPSGQRRLRIQTLDHHTAIGGPTAAPPPPPAHDVTGRLIPRDTATTREDRAYQARLRQPPRIVCDTTLVLTTADWQQLRPLLSREVAERPGVSAEINACCDGAVWLLEAQAPHFYRFWNYRDGNSAHGLAGWLLRWSSRACGSAAE